MHTEQTIPYSQAIYSNQKSLEKSLEWFEHINHRRTVRTYNSEPFPVEIIENCIRAASTAPSGAHKQPWTFCIIQSPEMKKKIRKAAEEEEHANYHKRMSEEWLKDLKPLGTNEFKPFLESAPYLIVVMKKSYDLDDEENKTTNYYVNESVGIASGFLLTALFQAGLVALTHTPSPMMFLKRLLNRPKNEQPFLLIPVSKPSVNMEVPNLKRKELKEITAYY